jgi:hypothetical protein
MMSQPASPPNPSWKPESGRYQYQPSAHSCVPTAIINCLTYLYGLGKIRVAAALQSSLPSVLSVAASCCLAARLSSGS